MKFDMNVVFCTGCCTAREDFVKVFEQGVSLTPFSLIEDLNHFLKETVKRLDIFLWQASGLVGYADTVCVYVYVNQQEIYHSAINVPRNSASPEEVLKEEKRICYELTGFRYESREKILVYIACSPEFRNQ